MQHGLLFTLFWLTKHINSSSISVALQLWFVASHNLFDLVVTLHFSLWLIVSFGCHSPLLAWPLCYFISVASHRFWLATPPPSSMSSTHFSPLPLFVDFDFGWHSQH